MSDDIRSILVDSLTRVLEDHCGPDRVRKAEEAGWDAQLWRRVADLGFPLAGIPEEAGGAGGGLGDPVALLRVAGRYFAPIPLAETGLLASWVLATSGAPVPDGPLTVAPVDPRDHVEIARAGTGWRLSGRARRVPMGRAARHIAVLAESVEGLRVATVDPALCTIRPGSNLAREPRDEIVFADVETDAVAAAGPGVGFEVVLRRGALARAAQMAGTLERALELSVAYAQERKQFGRAIGKFQAIQQDLALCAAEVSAAAAAVSFAVRQAEGGNGDLAIAAAKIRVGQAAGVAAKIAHQVHGAMGMTEEYPLQLATRRLWSWRDEFGTESRWAAYLGHALASRGAENFWPLTTGSRPTR